MNIINGIRCISLKKYGEQLGLSPSQVTAKINAGVAPVIEFEDISLKFINVDLLEIEQDISRAKSLNYATRETLETYSLSKMADFFLAMITRYTTQSVQNKQLLDEAGDALAIIQQSQTETNLALDEAHQTILQLRNKVQEMETQQAAQHHSFETETKKWESERTDYKTAYNELVSENKGLLFAVDILKQSLGKTTTDSESAQKTTNKRTKS